MPKYRLTNVVKPPLPTDALEWLRKSLMRSTKANLIEVIVEIARADRSIVWQLESLFGLQASSPRDLVNVTRMAITDATDFNERDVNRNFNYDYQAYETVKRNFRRLIDMSQLQAVMELSLELMRQGSKQVEMSDEGLMTNEIEECLQVVILALENCDLSAKDVIAWCADMANNDRGGFICERELQALRDRFKKPGLRALHE